MLTFAWNGYELIWHKCSFLIYVLIFDEMPFPRQIEIHCSTSSSHRKLGRRGRVKLQKVDGKAKSDRSLNTNRTFVFRVGRSGRIFWHFSRAAVNVGPRKRPLTNCYVNINSRLDKFAVTAALKLNVTRHIKSTGLITKFQFELLHSNANLETTSANCHRRYLEQSNNVNSAPENYRSELAAIITIIDCPGEFPLNSPKWPPNPHPKRRLALSLADRQKNNAATI